MILQEKIIKLTQTNEQLQVDLSSRNQEIQNSQIMLSEKIAESQNNLQKQLEEQQKQTRELEGKLIEAKLNLAQQSEMIDSLKHEMTQQKKQILEQQQQSQAEPQNLSSTGTPALSPQSESSKHFVFGPSGQKHSAKKYFVNYDMSNKEYVKAMNDFRNMLVQLQDGDDPVQSMRRKFSDQRHQNMEIFDQTQSLEENIQKRFSKNQADNTQSPPTLHNNNNISETESTHDEQANSDNEQTHNESDSHQVKFKSSNQLNKETGTPSTRTNLSVLNKRNSILTVISYDPVSLFQNISNAEEEKSNEEQVKLWKTTIMPLVEEKYINKLYKNKFLVKKCKNLIAKTIPNEVRSKIWTKLVYNKLNINKLTYKTFVDIRSTQGISQRTQLQIKEDIKRTYPNLSQFSTNAELQVKLQNVLELFHVYRPDIGYVQGMAYPVTIFLFLFNDEYKAFKYFSNIVIGNEFIKTLYQFQIEKIQAYAETFDELLRSRESKVAKHLSNLCIKSEIFLVEWFYTLFCRAFSMPTVIKVWDLFIYEGEVVFYKIALAIFSIIKDELIGLDFDSTLFFIRNCSHNIKSEKLIKHITHNKMTNKELYAIMSKQYEQIIQSQKQQSSLSAQQPPAQNQ